MLNNFFTRLSFTSSQRKGILVLLIVIVLLQSFYWFIDVSVENKPSAVANEWLSLQGKIEDLKAAKENSPKLYPFNPNFITDYKGYQLGMSLAEIDRLHAFRKTNRYVNSTKEFQKVTGVSNTFLNTIAPYFKFPDWVKNKKENDLKKSEKYNYPQKAKVTPQDINIASIEDLVKVYGIGETLATKIITVRESLGGFVAMEQLNEIWGLSPEAISNLNIRFYVSRPSRFILIDVNNASVNELARFHYFKYTLAKQIVIYRSMNGDYKNIEDLSKIKGFPVDKAKIIALYLKF